MRDSDFNFNGRPPLASAPRERVLACPACASTAVTTTAKIPDDESYWRCGKCGEVWNPGRLRGSQRGYRTQR
jgi:predicted Zn finger-like uncharacterized protein